MNECIQAVHGVHVYLCVRQLDLLYMTVQYEHFYYTICFTQVHLL